MDRIFTFCSLQIVPWAMLIVLKAFETFAPQVTPSSDVTEEAAGETWERWRWQQVLYLPKEDCCILKLFYGIRNVSWYKPVCSPPAVTLSSTDRCEGSFSLSSAAWRTSVMPFTGCHLASSGREDSPTGWLVFWAPSHPWLVWSRWAQAAITRQTAHRQIEQILQSLNVCFCQMSGCGERPLT